MKRSLAILAATAVCGGTMAVAAVAYASEDDAATGTSRTLPTWMGRLGSTASDSDDSREPECTLERQGFPALPKLEDIPEPPELLYGEQVVEDPETGDIERQVTQAGAVESVSDDELTVRSSDGTTWTWTLTDETEVHLDAGEDDSAATIEDGDRVVVHGTRDGDTRRAEHVGGPMPDLGELGERLREQLPDNLRKLPGLPHCDDDSSQNQTAA